jgi:glycosyltransferase involved in cell wall biosynthesis
VSYEPPFSALRQNPGAAAPASLRYVSERQVMKPLVSVVIPCYNAARYLGETIECVLAQEYPNVEIIVVDDGSTDRSADIAAKYRSVRCIRQRNAGVAAARNTGLLHSRGAFIVFLDADDRLLPGALESSLSCLVNEPDCAFTFGDVQTIDAEGSALPYRSSCPHEGKEHYFSLLHHCYIWTPSAVMYRRSVLDAVSGFDSRVAAAADYELNLRIARTYPVCHNRATILDYRIHSSGMNSNFALMLQATVTALRWQKTWVQRDRRYKRAIHHGIRFVQNFYGNSLMTQIAQNIYRRRQWRQTWAGTLILLRYAPLLAVNRAFRKAARLPRR